MRWRRVRAAARGTGRLLLVLLWVAAVVSLILVFGVILISSVPDVGPPPPEPTRTTIGP